MSERIVIIDGNSLINRAYYAMQKPMITKDGIYTQGIFGFINMLNKIIGDYEPVYLTVAFDLKAPTFRHLEYDAYKAGRKPMPPELVMQTRTRCSWRPTRQRFSSPKKESRSSLCSIMTRWSSTTV